MELFCENNVLAGAAGSPGSPGMAGIPGDRGVQGRRGRKGAEGIRYVMNKGVGPSKTLAWPGWKQPDIPVEVDTARLATCRFKNGFAKFVLLYCPCSEFDSTFNVY